MRDPLLLVAFGLAVYSLFCAVMPWGKCLKCHGDKRVYRSANPRLRRSGRRCPRCKGTGIRLRIGRRIFNRFHGEHDRHDKRPVPLPDREWSRDGK